RVERLERANSQDGSDALLAQAVRVATSKAIEAAQPTVLEPMVAFEVRCPAERRAAVHADLAGRGAAIRQVSSGQLGALLQGRGRLAAFLGYSTRLRSITQGQGEAQLQPDGYDPRVGDGGAGGGVGGAAAGGGVLAHAVLDRAGQRRYPSGPLTLQGAHPRCTPSQLLSLRRQSLIRLRPLFRTPATTITAMQEKIQIRMEAYD